MRVKVLPRVVWVFIYERIKSAALRCVEIYLRVAIFIFKTLLLGPSRIKELII